ncbi:sec-independent protein translocase protein TatA [bacterium BMS3Bbin12]|nr:sec-independent protein translocase protein TatA [bacterium BMS3Abin12]GBE47107.1 sec-independent protein translocase protein TatA [bacterium BMS3Bbin12]GBE51362.1 sec-independent protein translocase protein TatA [bacterium BMS3Bbin13]HDJ86158.1 twin-arginine translocase TatA/TatE family subunit [Chromatiales bacterium]
MGFGFKELLIILVIVLVLFGAKRLRNIGSDLGSAVRGFRGSLHEDEDKTPPPETDQEPTSSKEATGRVIEGEAQRQEHRQEKDKV